MELDQNLHVPPNDHFLKISQPPSSAKKLTSFILPKSSILQPKVLASNIGTSTSCLLNITSSSNDAINSKVQTKVSSSSPSAEIIPENKYDLSREYFTRQIINSPFVPAFCTEEEEAAHVNSSSTSDQIISRECSNPEQLTHDIKSPTTCNSNFFRKRDDNLVERSYLPISPHFRSLTSLKNTNCDLDNSTAAQQSTLSLHQTNTNFTKSSSRFPCSSKRKLSSCKISRVSPTQVRFKQYRYSTVPKSDSAFSEDSYSYSPVPHCNSPGSRSPKSSFDLLNSARTAVSYPHALQNSHTIYSELHPCRSSSALPKSHSTIFRSDSAYSEIEYSYSSIPNSESFCLEEYSNYCIPKSESTYSETTLSQNKQTEQPILRSQSFSSYQPAGFSSFPQSKEVSGKNSEILVSETAQDLNNHRFTSSSLQDSTACISSTSLNNAVMPKFKSFFKTSPRPSLGSFAANNENSPNERYRRESSALSLKLLDPLRQPEPSMKKSHTVLALSSNVSCPSTKLLHDNDSEHCKVHGCLNRSLMKSISQTLNESISRNLNSVNEASPRKKSRRISNLSALLPRSLSRTSSVTPSLGSYTDLLYCRLCLMDVSVNAVCQLSACHCRFCKFCMTEYTKVKIEEGEYRIECPDGSCDSSQEGAAQLTSEEIESFVGAKLAAQRNKLKLNADVLADPFRVFCPRPGCDTIIQLTQARFDISPSVKSSPNPPLPKEKVVPRSRRVGTTKNFYITQVDIKELDVEAVEQHEISSRKSTADDSSPTDQTSRLNEDIGSGDVLSSSSKSNVNPNFPENISLLSEIHSQHSTSSPQTSADDTSPKDQTSCLSKDISSGNMLSASSKSNLNHNYHENISIVSEIHSPSHQIKQFERPKVLVLDSSAKKQTDFSPNSGLSAALAGLQSPADYRPVALLSEESAMQDVQQHSVIDVGSSLHNVKDDVHSTETRNNKNATCPTCHLTFCASCGGLQDHSNSPCVPQINAPIRGVKRHYKKLVGAVDLRGVIKCCPNPKCQVAIERNEGCAQMQCRACKHTFCWYCLASLEDDFLLRHYDSGPCRNKLGHSRASVLCHRLQVILIFLGVGLMILAATPLLLVVGPCLLCCHCLAPKEEDAEESS